jgi:hypothetical protein
LIYVALLCPSPILFTGVVIYWLFSGGNIDWNHDDVDIVEKFAEVCETFYLKPRGGPMSRFQAQGGEYSWPTRNKKSNQGIKAERKRFMEGFDDLENGTFNRENIFCPKQVSGLGEMYGYSFASLAVFTGMCSSRAALEVAMKAKVNKNQKDGYTVKIGSWLGEKGGDWLKYGEKGGQKGSSLIKWKELCDAIGKKLGFMRPQDAENGFCARFRTSKKGDAFAYGQDLYSIHDEEVWVKPWGESNWTNFQKYRQSQKRMRRDLRAEKPNEPILWRYINSTGSIPDKEGRLDGRE